MTQMKHITKWLFAQLACWHVLALFGLIVFPLLGWTVEGRAGWLTCPPRWEGIPVMSIRRRRKRPLPLGRRLHALWGYVGWSWSQPLLRSLALGALWWLSGRRGSMLIMSWPWVLWLWQGAVAGWPELCRQRVWRGGCWLLWQGQRVLVVSYLCLTLQQVRTIAGQGLAVDRPIPWLTLGACCPTCKRDEPWVEVKRQEDGGYKATLCGHFTVRVSGDDPVRARLLMLFLRLLDGPGQARSSRRTREGRTPFVRQQQAAAWFGLPQPDVSRVERYWLAADWPAVLSQCTAEILTPEVVHRVVTVCATFPHWSQEQVYTHLREQGLAVSWRQMWQAMKQSGWSTLRHELRRRYHWTPASFQLRDKWLVRELLAQVRHLQECVEQGQPPPQEQQLALHDVQTLLREAGAEAAPPLKTLPWLLRVQQVVLGDWQEEVDTIRCPACGSTHIVRKSRKGRQKKYYDAQGQLQEVTVYRYYCRNPDCERGSFTHFPAGLVPYSRHRLEVHLLAWQAYAWGYSTYRRVGQTLQVSQMTVYRWVSAWGAPLLPVAALFGVVRSSGVVGVDEKYILVPKNDKPAAKMKRWMYVYLAVDVHTYDLLHIALYPYNTRDSAHAFLLALRTKGYHPRVVVTDLRRDYGPVIAQVFPKARHHECLFHAQQEIGRYLQKTWGRDYAEQQPEVEALRAAVVHIFQVRTKRTAQKRYLALLQDKKDYLQRAPPLQWVFAFLEQHWPTLVNSVESDLIPATNNAVEMVIRRFDQHYQTFCGFECIQTAQLYLGVFEKVYRFTPFSDDARPEIRGKSPLQLAGYDPSRTPMSWLCQGSSLEWPLSVEAGDVPNS
jgi:transposase-like protein